MGKNASIKYKLKYATRFDRAVGFVWQAGPGWTVANSVLILIQGVLPLLALYLLKLIVDAVTFALKRHRVRGFEAHAHVIRIAVPRQIHLFVFGPIGQERADP